MLTSVGADHIRIEALEKGVAAVLTKPARERELLREVSVALSDTRFDEVMNAVAAITRAPELARVARHTEDKGDRQRGGPLVLVAEDSETNQVYIRHVLKLMGLEAAIVPDGRRAVDYWRAHKPDVILMDISMPQMNGYDATSAIRRIEAETGRQRTPIIALTAHALSDDRQACLDAGMDDYLSKALSIQSLEGRLAGLGLLDARKQAANTAS